MFTDLEVIFVNYHRFEASSGIHIFHLANHLEELGVKCTVCIPSGKKSVYRFGQPQFRVHTYFNELVRSYLLKHIRPTSKRLVHAWTPREKVRKITSSLSSLARLKYVVHLEDNEEFITSQYAKQNQPVSNMVKLKTSEEIPEFLTDPNRYRQFLETSSGVTCINARLKEFVPNHLPSFFFWPGCEPQIFELGFETNHVLRKKLGLSTLDFVLVYPGNVHPANVAEVEALYFAVERLNRTKNQVRLVRIGADSVELDSSAMPLMDRWLIRVDSMEKTIPDYLEIANALVQPGHSNAFNDYRFPSKLPMFLASGRPVVLPKSNLGLSLADGENCMLLEKGDSSEIVEKIGRLMGNEDLRRKIGYSGREFARKNFSWRKSARSLGEWYRQVLCRES